MPLRGLLLAAAAAAARGDWVLVLDEDFDGPALNASLWEARANETHCEPCEPQLYVPSALSLANSSLLITTAAANATGPGGARFNWTSGWVDTKGRFSFTFGRLQARARLPAPNATGAWPAFWTLPANDSVCWPTGGEIDVFEATMGIPLAGSDVFGSLRWGTACGDDRQVLPGAAYPGAGRPPVDWTQWHVFGIEWNASTLAFSVDGETYEVKSAAAGDWVPQLQQYIILNTAIAWYWPPALGPAAYPAVTAFDWVRLWQWQDPALGA